jgi:aryl-alcohol dehydrogenase-like predicted oxidoreductase
MELRPLGSSGISITPVALGCWPMAGLTSAGATPEQSIATIRACFELGINHLDTAYIYGRAGESERYIAAALQNRRWEMVIATKGGLHWGPAGNQVHDASPETLTRECEESLRRLNTDVIDLYYLHAPDSRVPVAESAGAIAELIRAGKVRAAGASNVSVAQLDEFAAACPLAAYQPPYNMLQREIEADALPWCRQHGVAVMVYWPLLKGLLAGKLSRHDVLPPGDNRHKYPMFQGAEWEKNQDLVDELRTIADRCGRTVAQLVIQWTIQQPGITCALCGAKRPDQIEDNAGGAGWQMSPADRLAVDQALVRRGKPVTKVPV